MEEKHCSICQEGESTRQKFADVSCGHHHCMSCWQNVVVLSDEDQRSLIFKCSICRQEEVAIKLQTQSKFSISLDSLLSLGSFQSVFNQS